MFNLTLKLTKDESAALLGLRDPVARVLPALARAWAAAGQEVIGQAVKKRFTGKGPFPVAEHRLGVRSNRLRKSMRSTGPQIDATSGRISVSMGSNVSYFAGHEFGFRGQVQVKAHTRNAIAGVSRNARGAADAKLTRKQISGLKSAILVRGRSSGGVRVRQHSRRVNIPARRPLGTQLDDIQTRLSFRKRITQALRRILTPRRP